MDKLAPTPYKEVWGLADPHSLNEATNPLATFSDDPKGLMGLQPRGTRVTVGQYGQEARVSRETGFASCLKPNGPTTKTVEGTGYTHWSKNYTVGGRTTPTNNDHTCHSPDTDTMHSTKLVNKLVTPVLGVAKFRKPEMARALSQTNSNSGQHVTSKAMEHCPSLEGTVLSVQKAHGTKPIVNTALTTDTYYAPAPTGHSPNLVKALVSVHSVHITNSILRFPGSFSEEKKFDREKRVTIVEVMETQRINTRCTLPNP